MYRVYDNEKKKWVNEGIYLSPNDELSTSKKALFGSTKLYATSEDRYTYHRDIGLEDKNNKLIFEGDICSATSYNIMGVVAYVPEHASYYLLDDINLKYYPLGENYCKNIEIIGNVFDNRNLLHLAD